MNVDRAISGELEAGSCPHMAVLLKSGDELPRVLASFYALGATRNGWLVHRSLPGQADRDRSDLQAQGLQLERLEEDGRLVVVEFDPSEPPERSTDPWSAKLDEALENGFTALWYSRFAIGADPEEYAGVVPFERAWDAAFRDRPVVTLCPYVVELLDGPGVLDRIADVSSFHDGVLMPAAEDYMVLPRAGVAV